MCKDIAAFLRKVDAEFYVVCCLSLTNDFNRSVHINCKSLSFNPLLMKNISPKTVKLVTKTVPLELVQLEMS